MLNNRTTLILPGSMGLFNSIPLIIILAFPFPMVSMAQSGWATPFGGVLTVDGSILALTFDNQGRLYVGGYFEYAGGHQAHGLARWDGLQWDPLGDASMDVTAMHFVGDELFIAGQNNAPHAHAYQVARWTENGVIPIGQFREMCCSKETIEALASDSNGMLYVGGNFHSADSLSATSLTRWNGVRWDTLGGRVRGSVVFDSAEDTVYDVVVHDTIVYIGGSFNEVGEKTAFHVAQWNGQEWQSLGSGIGATNRGAVYALAMNPEGTLYAGGSFGFSGDTIVNNISQWDGDAWQPLGEGINGSVLSLAADENNLYAAGRFIEAGGKSSLNVARWDGASWHPLGEGINGYVYTLAIGPDGMLYAGGTFTEAGDVPARNLARWTGTAWESVGAGHNEGLNGSVSALAVADDVIVYAGGSFTEAGGVVARYIARWDGQLWHALGAGMNNYVTAIAITPGKGVVAGGLFSEAGDAPASHIALWDGQQWHPLGSGFNDSVEDVAVAADGRIYAIGKFTEAGDVLVNHIAMWDGQQWHPLGAGLNRHGLTLAIDTDGMVYAGGYFTEADGQAANRIAIWNGISWQALGTGVGRVELFSSDHVEDIAFHEGAVYVVGNFRKIDEEPASHIAKWDGLRWENLSNGDNSWLTDLAFTEQGNLYVGGYSLGGTDYIARWDDGEWDRLGEGVNSLAQAVAIQKNDVIIGGSFTRVGEVSSNFLAIWNEETSTAFVKTPNGIPGQFLTHSLYPNPSAGESRIAIELPYATQLRVEVYDLLGQLLAVAVDRHYPAGFHIITLSTSHFASGTYVYRLMTPGRSDTGIFRVI